MLLRFYNCSICKHKFKPNESCPTHGRLVDEGESQSYYGCSVCGGTGKVISVTGEDNMVLGQKVTIGYNMTFNGITYKEVHFRCYNCGVVPKSQSQTWSNVVYTVQTIDGIGDVRNSGPATKGPGIVPVRWCADCYPTLKSKGQTWYSVAKYEVPHLPPRYKLTIIDKTDTTNTTRSEEIYDKNTQINVAANIPAKYKIDSIECTDSNFSKNTTSGKIQGLLKQDTTITFTYVLDKKPVQLSIVDVKEGQSPVTRSGYPKTVYAGDTVVAAPNPPSGYVYDRCEAVGLGVDAYGNVSGTIEKNTVIKYCYKPKPTPTVPPTSTPAMYNVIIRDKYGKETIKRRSSEQHKEGNVFSCSPLLKDKYVFDSVTIEGSGLREISNGQVSGTVKSDLKITYVYKEKEEDDITIKIYFRKRTNLNSMY